MQSGIDTYTVVCVAPREIEDTRERAWAYVKRDRVFLLATLFWATWGSLALAAVIAAWASVVFVVLVGVSIFAWATK